jgi:hypothetical protein
MRTTAVRSRMLFIALACLVLPLVGLAVAHASTPAIPAGATPPPGHATTACIGCHAIRVAGAGGVTGARASDDCSDTLEVDWCSDDCSDTLEVDRCSDDCSDTVEVEGPDIEDDETETHESVSGRGLDERDDDHGATTAASRPAGTASDDDAEEADEAPKAPAASTTGSTRHDDRPRDGGETADPERDD